MYNHKYTVKLVNVRSGETRYVTITTTKTYIDSRDIPGYTLLDTYFVTKHY